MLMLMGCLACHDHSQTIMAAMMQSSPPLTEGAWELSDCQGCLWSGWTTSGRRLRCVALRLRLISASARSAWLLVDCAEAIVSVFRQGKFQCRIPLQPTMAQQIWSGLKHSARLAEKISWRTTFVRCQRAHSCELTKNACQHAEADDKFVDKFDMFSLGKRLATH